MMNIGLILAISFIEYIMSLSMALGACAVIDKVFRYPLKKYNKFIFSVSICLPVISVFLLLSQQGIPDDIIIPIYTLAIWIFLTDRSVRSLCVSLMATVFSFFAAYSALVALSCFLFNNFVDKNNILSGYLVNLGCNVVTLVFIYFIGRLGKSEINETLPVWNMVSLALISYLAGGMIIEVSSKNGEMSPIVFLGFVAITMSVILAVKSSEKNFYIRISKVNENYLNAQEKYYDSKQKSETEIRQIKHDMKNHLICIADLSRKGKYEQLDEYISELSERLVEAEGSVNTGSDIANAIITDKLSKANSENIKLSVSGSMTGTEMSPIDVCTILSNLLDNAIEASEKLPESMRKIDLSFKQSMHFILMTVTNPTSDFVVTNETAKADKINHGFGIMNVRKAAEKYGGELNLNCDKSETGYLFTAEVILPKS